MVIFEVVITSLTWVLLHLGSVRGLLDTLPRLLLFDHRVTAIMHSAPWIVPKINNAKPNQNRRQFT